MRVTVKEVNIRSAARAFGVLGIGIGFIFGATMAIGSLVATTTGGHTKLIENLTAILWAPLLHGIFGWLAGGVLAALYNTAADYVGGVRLELHPEPADDIAAQP